MKQIKRPAGSKQKGATLFIGIILLLAISLVCITAMRTSLLELVMANNNQQINNAFQAAESVLENSIVNMAVELDADDISYIENPASTADRFLEAITEITFEGSGNSTQAKADGAYYLRSVTPANGWQLDLDAQAFHFRIESNGTSASGEAVSNNSAGVYIIAPLADASD